MTTYGTIPTTQSQPPPPPHEFISRATGQIQSHLATRRPWSELFSLSSLSLPASAADAAARAKLNLAYFRANYAIVILLSLFFSLLTHPASLVVFVLMMAAWLLLYFLRDAPLAVAGRVVDDNVVLVVLGVPTVLFLLLTDVTVNIVVAVAVGVLIVAVHASIRQTDDLRVSGGEFEDERVGLRGGFGERLPLKDTASSGYSS